MSKNELVALASQIKNLRETQKKLGDKLADLENQLKEALGPKDTDICLGNLRIIVKTVEQTRLDSKGLRLELGDDFLEPFLSTVFQRRLTIK